MLIYVNLVTTTSKKDFKKGIIIHSSDMRYIFQLYSKWLASTKSLYIRVNVQLSL